MTEITIQEMALTDLDEVEAMEKKIFTEPWSLTSFRTMLGNPYSLYLTARADGKLAGYCGLFQSFEDACIQNVAVGEEYRDRGIATAMLGRLMELGKERGILNYTLEVRISNAPAIRVYEKLGFITEGRRKNFYSLPTEDAFIMWKRTAEDHTAAGQRKTDAGGTGASRQEGGRLNHD